MVLRSPFLIIASFEKPLSLLMVVTGRVKNIWYSFLRSLNSAGTFEKTLERDVLREASCRNSFLCRPARSESMSE